MYNFEPRAVDTILREMRVLTANSQYSLGVGFGKFPGKNLCGQAPRQRDSCSATKTTVQNISTKSGTPAYRPECSDTEAVAEGAIDRRHTPRLELRLVRESLEIISTNLCGTSVISFLHSTKQVSTAGLHVISSSWRFRYVRTFCYIL